MMTIKVTGVEETIRALQSFGDSGKFQTKRAIVGMAEKVRGDAIKSIHRGPKTGTVYVRGSGRNLSKRHRASAPGEAPATDTGNLVGTVFTKVEETQGEVGFTAPYGYWLEYGTLKMKPRPFLNPALEKNKDYFEGRLKQGIEKAVAEFNKN